MLTIPGPAGLDSLQSSFFKRVLPTIKSDLSLVNSIYELKDFKSLPSTVKKLVTGFRKLPSWLSSSYGYFRKRALSFLVREGAAENYLQWKFNLAPLLSDIAGVYSALSGYERRLNDLISRAGQPQRRHYDFKWSEFPDTTEYGDDNWFILGDFHPLEPRYRCRASRVVTYSPTVVHFEIEYNFNYTRFQIEHARLLSILDSLGVNLNPSIIWNAIPWTFVVDWVIGVSRWLDQFKIANMQPQINISRCLWSVKRQRIITCSRQVSNRFDVATYDDPWMSLPSVHETSYRRQTFMPGFDSITSSGLNSQEFTLGAALVITRRRRHGTKTGSRQ